MGGFRTLVQTFLRGRLALSVAMHVAPFLVLIILGSFWLVEHGWLLPFLVVTTAVLATFRLITWAFSRRILPTPTGQPVVGGNPEWSSRERDAYLRLSAEVKAKLTEPVPWSDLQQMALTILQRSAEEISGGKKSAMDFSIPEALLLADRIITRLRGDLRRYVPMADTVSISTLLWLWEKKLWFQRTVKAGQIGYRLYRGVTNPLAAILQEAQNLLMSPEMGNLQFAGQAMLQQIILEEVISAAIDLHAGYLRFTEAELLEIELAATEADLGRTPVADLPLHILVVGQISAGKTSLINALAEESLGETDITPTTKGLTTHKVGLGEADLTFVDSAGIDGSHAVEDHLLAELLQADLIIWAIRANRPARAPDAALLTRLRQSCDQALRRRPPIVIALTGVDLLLRGWPFAENLLPKSAMSLLGEVIAACSQELDEPCVVPVCLAEPGWNLDALESVILSYAPEALMVQRNRRRLESKTTVVSEIAKGLEGLGQISRLIASRWRS